MLYTLRAWPLVLLSLLILGCAQEDDCCFLSPTIADEEWSSISIKRDRETWVAPHDLCLAFDTDSTYTLLLDVNRCSGQMQLDLNSGTIEILNTSCTFACCDSEYSVALFQFLMEVDRFEILSKNLILYSALDEARFELK